MKISYPKKIIKKKFCDKRGYFQENFKKKIFNFNPIFSAISCSKKNVIRGMHVQLKKKQEITLTVVSGKIMDVCIDIRINSKFYGKKFINILNEGDMLHIPKGFLHGFESLKNKSRVFYQFSNYRDKKSEINVSALDKFLRINWKTKKPIFSPKDLNGISFKKFNNIYMKKLKKRLFSFNLIL